MMVEKRAAVTSHKPPYMAEGGTLMLKCFLCGNWIVLHADRNGRPFGFCPACGVHVHFHKQEGLDLLESAVARHLPIVKTSIPSPPD